MDSKYYYVIAVVLLFGGVIGIYMYSLELMEVDEPVLSDFNGYHMSKDESGLWNVYMKDHIDENGDPHVLLFHYNAFEVMDIPVKGNLTAFLPAQNIYISTDITKVTGDGDLIKALSELSFKMATSAFFIQKEIILPKIVCDRDNDPACADTEIISCDDTDKKVIYLQRSDESMITAEGNCIRLLAKEGDYVKLVDRLLYSWVGVIQ